MSSAVSICSDLPYTPDSLSVSETSMESVNDTELEPAMGDPTVIVGMACRAPGVINTSQLWDIIAEKKDLRRKIPENRFNVDAFYHPQGSNKGTTNGRYGYFLDQDIALFDNEFFRISGIEAESMDPQQRLLLEVVYEALENAGITLDEISGTRTSVYVGSFSNDYNSMISRDQMQYPKHIITGSGNAILSNRISYYYNLHGPSMTIDTACSSSLVCFHLGNKSIQTRESDISIVAGSALHFDPNIFITMTDFGMLSTDGRCRTFDADGSGYVRGEGVCAVILKRKSQAESNGDTIRSVIRGTGANHDGIKDGLTLPNEQAQENLIRRTYKNAGLPTADTEYFEAHGTGTKAGDPREALAIGRVFASNREKPLLVGSIKSNIGHLEGASGLVAIIKATMSLERAKILPNMHFTNPSPAIEFEKLKIQVPTSVIDWTSETGVRRASVNSFGYGGSNAHAILENYQNRPKPSGISLVVDVAQVQDRPYLVPMTSHSEKAGKLLVAKLINYIQQHDDLRIADLANNLSIRRSMHQYRSFAIANDRKSMLQELTEPKPNANWTRTLDLAGSPRVGFIFTGQGAQWYAMGRQLLEKCILFRQTIERCDEVLTRLPDAPDWSILSEFLKSYEESRISQSLISLPLCTALQLGLVEILQAWGIKPVAVVGHSSGEIAAAYTAGLLSFEEAIICAYYRGLYMSKGIADDNLNRGAMIAVGLTEAEGRAELKAYQGRISLAAINSPENLTLSGDEDSVIELKQNLEAKKIFVRQLRVEQAFHSHHMKPLAPAFQMALSRTLETTTRRVAKCQLVSSVTARDSSAQNMDAVYWTANMTGVVRYADALTGILLNQHDDPNLDLLVEIGPHPALQGASKQVMQSLKLSLPYIATLTRQVPALESLLTTTGQLFALGYPVDLAAVNSSLSMTADGQIMTAPLGNKLDDLPTYAWDHARFWAETRVTRELRFQKSRHSILGQQVPGAPSTHPRWRNYIRQSELPWLFQHVVNGKAIFPAAGYISIAIEAIATLKPSIKKIMLRDVMFKSALTLSSAEAGAEIMLELQPVSTSAKSSSSTWFKFIVNSFDESDRTIEHCHGLICAEIGDPEPLRSSEKPDEFAKLVRQTNHRRPRIAFYEKLNKLGLQYGKDFQLLSGDIESGPNFAIAPITFQPAQVIATEADACLLHPTILDASFHAIFASIETQMAVPIEEAFVPTFLRSMTVSGLNQKVTTAINTQNLWVKAESRLPGSRVAINELSILAEHSNDVLVNLKGLEVTALGNVSATTRPKRDLFFQIKWNSAFDQLGKNSRPLSFRNIGEVMDLFAHQFPDCKILHRTHSLFSTKEVLRYLGGRDGVPRRFQSLTPWSDDCEQRASLEAQYADLLNWEIPIDDKYDVIVLSKPADFEVARFLKLDGLVIVDGLVFNGEGLTEIFRFGKYSSFKRPSPTNLLAEDLAVLVSSKCSDHTKAFCSAIRDTHPAAVEIITIAELLSKPPSSQNIISLVSLDENLFFDQATERSILFQGIQTLFTSPGKNIVWLLHGATQETTNPTQNLMLGLARTVRSENEDIRLLMLDLPDKYAAESSARRALQLLDRSFAEEDVAERNGLLLIPRIEVDDTLNHKLPYEANRRPRLEPFRQDRKLALKIGKVGLLDTLQFEDDDDVISSDLGEDDVEVEVKASAINFRDIAASMGIIDDYRLGDECSGVVIRCGSNVKESEFKPGDRVIACRPGQGAHRSIVRNHAILCQKIGDMDFVTAASFEGVLTTAYYSLIDIARIQPGEYCLIHSAAGGVGQMAIQLVQMIGGKVIATVGSQQKRDFLKGKFGIPDEMIFTSRDASFVDGVLNVTQGRGCDVALNSLAGELLQATWGCIAPFGRLIEIGKRDIHENSKLDMEPFRKNIAYASIDLITLFHLNKPLLARLMRDSYQLIATGKIMPPGPITRISYGEAHRGFRLLQMGKYFGKVVLVPGEDDIVPVVPASYRNTDLFNPVKSYLLVGGLGGIGRALAEWMFRRGARKLIFLSRSGIERSSAKACVEWLTARNVEVSIFRGDVADMEVVEECINSAKDTLAGIFQAAMVLRDTPYTQMNLEQWQECMEPKVRGTWNLHMASSDCDLDFFVCFSSGASVLGSIAQANYAAANSYMDALMRNRRENGLQGVTMNVGMVTGVGAVAEDVTLEKTMDRLGYEAITEAEMFYQIEEAVTRQSSHSPMKGYDYHRFITGINMQRKDLYWAKKAVFRNLYANLDVGTTPTKARGGLRLATSLRNAKGAEEKEFLLMDAFIEKVAGVLAVPATTIKAGNPLSTYGLDSIVAVEFRKWFSQEISVEISLFEILGAKSIEALVKKVSEAVITSNETSATVLKSVQQVISASNKPEHPLAKQQMRDEFTVVRKRQNIPMSTYQNRIWFLHNTLEDKSALNLTIVCYAHGKPKLPVLQHAIDELVKRNDILRTAYLEGDEFAEQVVQGTFLSEIQAIDFSAYSEPEKELELYTKRSQAMPLNIENGEVMRLSWAKLSDSHWAMVFVFHHITIDNGSTWSFMDQFTALYDAIGNGKELSGIRAPQISYSTFTLWHMERLQSIQIQSDMKWWQEKLSGAPVVSRLLPFAKHKRPPGRSSTRSVLRDTLEMPLLKRMKRICSQLHATPFQFLLTAFRAFIYRYNEEDDLTLLMIDGNRPHPDLSDILGFFVNIIPVRCRNDCESSSFEDLLVGIKSEILEAIAHSQVPFDVIVNIANTQKTDSHFPLGQITINYQMYGNTPKYKTRDFEIDGVVVEDIPTASEISLEALEDPQLGLRLRLEYDSFLYGSHEMERFLENFLVFLRSIIKDHRQTVDEIDMCGSKELEYLRTNCWAVNTEKDAWDSESVLSKVESLAKERPHATAIVTSDGQSISYQDLVRQASKIAYSLRGAGLAPGCLVGILAHPGIDMIAAMMGVVQLRCGYVPLDPRFAKGRLARIAEDSGITMILVGENMLAFAATVEYMPRLMEISAAACAADGLSIEPEHPNDPFYAMYTSGSTGKPKGVVITHANTQAMLFTHNNLHQLSPQDTVLFHISMSFDLSVAQIWGSLTSGATMALSTHETTQDPLKLAHFMRSVGVTVTYFTPTQFALLLGHGREDLAACSKYRSAIFCGEYLPIRLVKEIYDLKTPVTVYNQWGPTEATVQTSSHKTAYPNDLDLNLPIGFPIPNCSHYIVDRTLKPIPANVVGEICISGAQVGLGYINLPDITAKAFVEDTFASDDFRAQGWTRMYRTGDRGRFLSDGQIDFRGRISGDKQIKLRGCRIDLAEIENEIHLASKKLDGLWVVDVTILPRERASDEFNSLVDNRELVAFIVPNKPCTKTVQQEMANTLHSIISHHLNDYMLPCGYQFMDSLPSLVSSKIDRQVLLESKLDLVHPSSANGIESGKSDSAQAKQEVLSSVITQFRQVLKLPETHEVQPNDRFFELGGSSLLLIRLRAVLKRKFNVDIPVAELFHQPTPIGITQKIIHHQTPDPNGSKEIIWSAEATLPNEERYYPISDASSNLSSDITDILITGVESCTGINMLAALLSASQSTKIHVMGSEKRMTPNELAQIFEEQELFNASLSRDELLLRTRCVPGTLADAQFGLTCQEFKTLGRTVQSIYHLGSQVSLLKTYTDIKRMNVGSTLDIIELAGQGLGLTKIHYLSTWSVPHLQTWSITKRTWNIIDLSESAPSHYQPGGDDKFGYFKSRWVAEMLLCEAAKRKFPVSIYRASSITAGTTQNAQIATPNSFTTNMILNMIKLGCVPEFNLPSSSLGTPSFVIDLIPVHYLTSVLATLSTGDFSEENTIGSRPKYYHISNPAPLALQDLPALIAKIRADGVTGSTVALSEWKRLMRDGGNDAENPRQQMEWNVFEEYLDLGHAMLSLDTTKTRAALEKLGGNASKSGIITCPPVDEIYLGNLFRSLAS